MSRAPLRQLERLFLTDAGLETDLIFNRGIDLPHFASVVLLDSEAGRSALETYYRGYLDLARRTGVGFILESATWRASRDWARPSTRSVPASRCCAPGRKSDRKSVV